MSPSAVVSINKYHIIAIQFPDAGIVLAGTTTNVDILTGFYIAIHIFININSSTKTPPTSVISTINLRYPSDNGVGYDAIWCGEVDCLTGELRNLKQYIPGTSPMTMQFVPFSVVRSVMDLN